MGLGARQQFGRYVATSSRLHALDPLTKVALFIALVVAVFLASTWLALALVAAYVAGLVASSRVRIGFYLESLKYFTWMLALSLAVNLAFPREGRAAAFTPEALGFAAVAAARLALMVLAAAVFTVVTSPSEIGDCAMVFSRIRGPVGRRSAEFASILAIALRFVPVIFEEAERIRAAQGLRGARPRGLRARARSVTQLVVPLLESALRRASNLGFAMEARCYGYRVPASRRTRFGPGEAVAAASVLVLLLLTALMR
jgi:energy-coupling factor transport system permease protein